MKGKFFLLVFVVILCFLGLNYYYQNRSASIDSNLADDQGDTKSLDFEIEDINGNYVKLSDYYGKPVIVNFWVSKCGPCRHEMPDFNEVYLEYKNKVNFIMIDSLGAFGETKNDGIEYIKSNKYDFSIFFDTDGKVQAEFGIYSYPTTLLLDESGMIVKFQQGIVAKDDLIAAIEEELKN